METINDNNNYFTLSIVSVVLTGLFISINQYFDLGVLAFVILPILMIFLPIVVLILYKKTQNKYGLGVYAVLNLGIIMVFGFIDGFLDHTLKSIGFILLKPILESHGGGFSQSGTLNLITDGSGVLVFIGSLFMAFYLYKIIKSAQDVETEL